MNKCTNVINTSWFAYSSSGTMQGWALCTVGFIVFAINFISVCDIYLSTPIFPLKHSYVSTLPAPAKRLVFIVADGLRADKLLKLFPNLTAPAPFIRYAYKVSYHNVHKIEFLFC